MAMVWILTYIPTTNESQWVQKYHSHIIKVYLYFVTEAYKIN